MMVLTHECSAIIQRLTISKKLEDPGCFTLPCAIGPLMFERCLCDLGASVSLMPLSVAKKLGFSQYKKCKLSLVLADRSVKFPIGILEDLPVMVGNCEIPTDFVEDGKRLASDERVLDDAYKSTPSKKARAPRSHSVGPLVLEKNTKKDAEKPKLPTKIRIKAPNPKQLAPPPLEPVDTTVEEASSPIESEAEQETFEKLGFNPRRDRQRKPTEVELLEQMRQGVSWPPTRFADERLMRELEIDQDIKDLLALMNMDSFYSMAHPTYKEISCQFLASLEVTFHSSQHEEQGWGRISFKIDGKPYFMTFTEIGEVLGLKDLKESYLPKLKGLPKGKTLAHFTYKFLSGKNRVSSRDKNASIRHPSVRYLHRLIVHTIYPRKEPSNVNGEDLNLMHQAIQHFALPPHLPEVPTDFYAEFGMVGYFVRRLMYYKEYAWTNKDPEAQIGIAA
ncbi:hypothetical protein Bca101_021145 [Brassica carinata]